LKKFLPSLLKKSHVQIPKTHEINPKDLEPQESSCLHQCSYINWMYMNYSKISTNLRQHVTLIGFNERAWFVRFEFEATKCFQWPSITAHACILKDLVNLRIKLFFNFPLRLHIHLKLLNEHEEDGVRCVSFSSD
jgi:hypothetical protein